MKDRTVQKEFDFGHSVAFGYLEHKEAVIFSLIRKACPGERIYFKLTKKGRRRQFKIHCRDGSVYILAFTEEFLFYRNLEQLEESLSYNLDYMKKDPAGSRALFTRSTVFLRKL